MAESSPVVTGQLYTADNINALRNDVLQGHAHDGVDGVRVPFSNLDVSGVNGSTVPSGGGKSYNDLSNHVTASHGQHGLLSSIHVMGAVQQSMLLQAGNDNLGYSTGNGIVQKTVQFPVQYSGSVVVICSTGVSATGVSNSQFVAESDDNNVGVSFSWIALGVKTA